MENKRKKILKFFIISLIILFLLLLSIGSYFILKYKNILNSKTQNEYLDNSKSNQMDSLEKIKQELIEKQEIESIKFLLTDTTANESRAKGRLVTILITGLDSRMGTKYNHADANHLIKIWLDSSFIQVISIPRGTFVDLGRTDSINTNYLANVRSTRGIEKYHKEICKITKTEKIDYFIEFGFAQAIGLIELLGFKENSKQMLQVLRSRKSYGIGDYQRSYNQGMFIRQSIIKQINKKDDIFEDLLLRAGLSLVETNLNFTKLKEIISELKSKQIGKDIANFQIKLMPKFTNNVKLFDFYDKEEQKKLIGIVNNTAKNLGLEDKNYDYNAYLTNKIRSKIKFVEKDTVKNPMNIQKQLKTMYDQHIWLQITNNKDRDEIRTSISKILVKSFENTGNRQEAKRIIDAMELEKKALNLK